MDNTIHQRFWAKVNKNGPMPKKYTKLKTRCWIWLGNIDKNGYGRIRYNKRAELAHRVAWMLKYGKFPKQCVLHKCDTPGCMRHLFKGTRADNNLDCRLKNRMSVGIKHSEKIKARLPKRPGELASKAILTNKDALTIRKLYASGSYTYRQLGVRYGVGAQAIYQVVKFISFKNLVSK